MQLAPFPVHPFPDGLRDYQEESILSVHAHLVDGRRAVLGVAATGAGKTVLALTLARSLDARTLWVTHRDELIGQTVEPATQWWPECAGIGVVKAQRHEVGGQLVVASVQSIARPKRLARMPKFDLVIVDEAHHIRANQYKAVLAHFGAGQPGGPVLYGTTATPDRADGLGLSDVFEAVAFNLDIAWALEHGHLADLQARSVDVGIDLSKVRTKAGDFSEGDLEEAMLAVPAPQRIVTEWLRYAEQRKTVVFVPTVRVAELVAEEYRRVGVAAQRIDGTMGMDERRALLAQFRAGHIRVLTNALLLTEGFDDPSIECIVLARPTKSRPLYAQAVGRGLRPHPGKADCLVLDVVGASHLHSLVTAADLLGVHELLEGDTAKAALARKADDEERERAEVRAEAEESWAEGETLMFDVDPLQRPRGRRYAWVHEPVRNCRLRWIVEARDVRVVVRTNDHPLGHHVGRKGHPWSVAVVRPGEKPEIVATGTLKAVLDKAERWLDGNGGRKPGNWRDDPATPKQVWWLRHRGVDARTLTKGDAGKEITRLRAVEDHKALAPARDLTPEKLAALVSEGLVGVALLNALGVPERLHGEASAYVRRISEVAADRGLLERGWSAA